MFTKFEQNRIFGIGDIAWYIACGVRIYPKIAYFPSSDPHPENLKFPPRQPFLAKISSDFDLALDISKRFINKDYHFPNRLWEWNFSFFEIYTWKHEILDNVTLAISKPPEAKILKIKALEICENGVLNIIELEYLGHIKTAGGWNFGNQGFRNVSEWSWGSSECYFWIILAISKPAGG